VVSAIRARRYNALVSLMNFGPILCPIPHILVQHNPLYFSPVYRASADLRERLDLALRRRLTIEAMRFAEVIVTPTSAMADLIRDDCPGLRGKNFSTLYHGFEAADFSPNADEVAGPKVEGSPKLLYTAHLGRNKNFEVLFHALARLKEAYPGIVLILTFNAADHAEHFRHYEKMAEDLGVSRHVAFIGRVRQDQVGALYRAADLFVFPSISESFGYPMLEAIACGLPVAASELPVHREICREAALYFDPNDGRSCADCIQTLLEQSAVRGQLLAGGREVLERFDWGWQRYAAEFVNLLERTAVCRAA
jgi:glycosyltransferase involved in cell wall biosynthesis